MAKIDDHLERDSNGYVRKPLSERAEPLWKQPTSAALAESAEGTKRSGASKNAAPQKKSKDARKAAKTAAAPNEQKAVKRTAVRRNAPPVTDPVAPVSNDPAGPALPAGELTLAEPQVKRAAPTEEASPLELLDVAPKGTTIESRQGVREEDAAERQLPSSLLRVVTSPPTHHHERGHDEPQSHLPHLTPALLLRLVEGQVPHACIFRQLVLLSIADQNREIELSLSGLESVLGLSKGGARKTIEVMKENGCLEVLREGGGHTKSRYRVAPIRN